jgi:replicative DNA helicase
MDNQNKILPHNKEAEKAVLGSMILDPECILPVSKIITKTSFYFESHRIIFECILQMHIEKEDVDLLTLSSKLKEKGVLDSIGGISNLADITHSVPSSINSRTYARVIQDKYTKRQLIQISEKIRESCFAEQQQVSDLLERTDKALKEVKKISKVVTKTGDAGIDEMIKKLEHELVEIKDDVKKDEQLDRLTEIAKKYAGEDKLISSLEYVDRIKSQPVSLKMMTKFDGIDKLIDGFRLGQLVSISAAAKSGKTSFCIELTTNQKEYNPVWFPFEEGAEELVDKFMHRNETPPLFFTPARLQDRSMGFIERRIIEAIAKYDSKIFYIDNLDWIVDPLSSKHDLEIQHACMELKRMAVSWNICIVLIAHIKKMPVITDQPTYNDIKGSSAVYQLSDTVIMMWRETKKVDGEIQITANVNVSVQLNRKTGRTGNVKLTFDNGHYKEYDWKNGDGFGDYSDENLKQTKVW